MKTWQNATVEELNLDATQYGGDAAKEFDYIYQNAEGNWEGTFVAS